jgi:hypothetical protein
MSTSTNGFLFCQLSKREVLKKTVQTATIVVPGWIPPPLGMVKINVDAAVGKNTGCGSVAMIARSDTGGVHGCFDSSFPGHN